MAISSVVGVKVVFVLDERAHEINLETGRGVVRSEPDVIIVLVVCHPIFKPVHDVV